MAKLVTITLDGALETWADMQPDVAEAIKQVLLSNFERMHTPFDAAIEQFRKNLRTVPDSLEFEVPQIVGSNYWEPLDRASRLALGKHIKANQEAFGVNFVRTTSARHAVYKRA